MEWFYYTLSMEYYSQPQLKHRVRQYCYDFQSKIFLGESSASRT